MKLSTLSTKILAASLLLLSTTGLAAAHCCREAANYKGEAFANPCPAPCSTRCLRDGFYVGGQFGYDSYRVRENIGITGLTANPPINAVGWVGGLFLGFGQNFNNLYYLGGEIFANYSNASDGYSINTYNSNFRPRYSYGVAVLPGIKFNDATLGYIRLGYNWASLKASESTTTASTSRTSTRSGFNYGLGMETVICDPWSIRTEYSHTNYNSFTTSFGTKFSPSDNQFMLGLIYHF